MKRPQARQDGKADEHDRESPHLKLLRKRKLRELRQIKGFRSTDNESRNHHYQHHRAADEGVERQFHGPIFAIGGSPDGYQKILRDNREFIKDEEQKEIETEENAVNAADQGEIKSEKLFQAVLDVPGEQDTSHGSQSGQEHEHGADPVGGEMILNAQLGHPGDFHNRLNSGSSRQLKYPAKSEETAGATCQQRDRAYGSQVGTIHHAN